MSDFGLLMFGALVTFITFAGFYVHGRATMLSGTTERLADETREPSLDVRPLDRERPAA